MTKDGDSEIGKISKQYAGFIREAFTTADRFGIFCKLNYFCYQLEYIYFFLVPADLSVKTKGTLIGALFLIVIKCC